VMSGESAVAENLFPSDSLETLFTKVSEATGIPRPYCKLVHNGSVLQQHAEATLGQSLSAAGLDANSKLTAVRVEVPIYSRGCSSCEPRILGFSEDECQERIMLLPSGECFLVCSEHSHSCCSSNYDETLQLDALWGTYKMEESVVLCTWHVHLRWKECGEQDGRSRWEEMGPQASFRWKRLELPECSQDCPVKNITRSTSAFGPSTYASEDWRRIGYEEARSVIEQSHSPFFGIDLQKGRLLGLPLRCMDGKDGSIGFFRFHMRPRYSSV